MKSEFNRVKRLIQREIEVSDVAESQEVKNGAANRGGDVFNSQFALPTEVAMSRSQR